MKRSSSLTRRAALGGIGGALAGSARWGLAAYGAPGVQRIHEILQGDLVMAMAQTGRPTFQ